MNSRENSLPRTTSDPKNLYDLLSSFVKVETEKCPKCGVEWMKIRQSDQDIHCDCGYLILKAKHNNEAIE